MQDRKGATYIVTIFVVFVLISIGFYVLFPVVFSSNPFGSVSAQFGGSVVDLPRVQTSITSDDGTYHPISCEVSVEIDSKKVSGYDKKIMTSHINKALESLDYDKLNSENNVEYIKTALAAELSSYVSLDDLKGIYLTDVSSGSLLFPDLKDRGTTPEKSVEDMLKGMDLRKNK